MKTFYDLGARSKRLNSWLFKLTCEITLSTDQGIRFPPEINNAKQITKTKTKNNKNKIQNTHKNNNKKAMLPLIQLKEIKTHSLCSVH